MEIVQSVNTSTAEIDRIYELQRSYLRSRKIPDLRARLDDLKKLKRAIFAFRPEIEKALREDLRKPSEEATLVEIYPTVSELRHTISHLEDWMRDKEVETPITFIGSSSWVYSEPKGHCLLISPWNYPFYLTMGALISALAAGNVCLIKPSEFSHHTTSLIKKLLLSCFPEERVAVVEGDGSVSQHLLKLRFDHIHFTGSPAIGKIVMNAASAYLTSVTLELGGKSPVIVDETASLSVAAKRIVWGKMLNCGQTCIAPDYLLVHSKVKQEFIQIIKKEIENQSGGSDIQASNGYARMINAKHFGRIESMKEDAMNHGAQLLGGGKSDEKELFIEPTLLEVKSGVKARVMQEEIFGPLLPVITFENIEEAIEMVRSGEKPLALYVFSRRQKNIDAIVERTSSGGVMVNDVVQYIAHPELPFGGVNNSGIGKSSGEYGFKEFSNMKPVMRHFGPLSMAQLTFPPYSKFKKFLIEFSLRYL